MTHKPGRACRRLRAAVPREGCGVFCQRHAHGSVVGSVLAFGSSTLKPDVTTRASAPERDIT